MQKVKGVEGTSDLEVIDLNYRRRKVAKMVEGYSHKAKLLTAALLPWIIEKKRTCTYGELSRLVEELSGERIDPWRPGWGNELGELQDICQELDLPCVPVMAVKQDTLLPSEGFYAKYDELHPEDSDIDKSLKRQQAVADVLACSSWAKLYDYFDIAYERAVPLLTNQEKAKIFYEGERKVQNRITKEIVRNPDARRKCLELYGTTCKICSFSSIEKYGVEGVIHVHHLHPLAEYEDKYATDPETDLIPVCPNCHAILHSKPNGGCFKPEEVRQMLNERL